MPTPELRILAIVATLTLLMWVPYTTARVLTRGLWRALGDPADPAAKPDPAWAERARRAHANAVENLAVFAPLVVILALTGTSTAATVTAAQTYLGARVAHFLVYAAGLPGLRTLAFAVGFGANLVLAAAVLGHG